MILSYLADTLCGAQGSSTDCGIPQVSLTQNTLQTVVGNVFLGIGVLSVIFLIVGGVRYTISGGEPANTKQAKETILYAVIGLIISILAFTLVAVAGKVAGGGKI